MNRHFLGMPTSIYRVSHPKQQAQGSDDPIQISPNI